MLVGVGAVSQREEDPARAREPLALMASALERAAEDAGSRALLARADSIRAPRGFWHYPDPCRMLAGALRRVARAHRDRRDRRAPDDAARARGGRHRRRARRRGARDGRRGAASRAARDEDRGRCAAHAAGAGHAGHRAASARADPERARDEGRLADARLAVRDDRERAARGGGRLDRDAPRRGGVAVGRLRAVAAENPDAWSREAWTPRRSPTPRRNPMLAFPYGKLHCSQWNVDQAAGLVFCSVATARALGIPRARWIFPLAVADANQMIPFTERRALHRCAGFAKAAERVFARTGSIARGRRAPRALLVLSVRGADPAARTRDRRRSPAHRDGRDGLRRRSTQSLRVPGARAHGAAAARRPGQPRPRHGGLRHRHQAGRESVVERAVRSAVRARRRERGDRARDRARRTRRRSRRRSDDRELHGALRGRRREARRAALRSRRRTPHAGALRRRGADRRRHEPGTLRPRVRIAANGGVALS